MPSEKLIRKTLLELEKHDPIVKLGIQVGARYGVRRNKSEALQHGIGNLRRIAQAIGGVLDETAVKGKNVLDLACGTEAMDQREVSIRGYFAPWVCRTMAYLGANVTGVDISYPVIRKGKPSVEPGWTFFQRNLIAEDAIDEGTFISNSFDIVTCSNFIGNNNLQDDPNLATINAVDAEFYMDVLCQIDDQVRRVLREGGIYLLNYTVMQKQQDALKVLGYLPSAL